MTKEELTQLMWERLEILGALKAVKMTALNYGYEDLAKEIQNLAENFSENRERMELYYLNKLED